MEFSLSRNADFRAVRCLWLVPFLVSLSIPGLVAAADSQVMKCSKKFGSMAVSEPQTGWGYLQQYGLGSPAALIRAMIQESGCFDVVERGVAMQNIQQERALANNGDLRADSNIGQGQMQGADFVLSPTVQIGAKTTGGVGAGVGGLLGGFGHAGGLLIGSVAGGLKFKQASTSITIADVRSSIQIAAAEGNATKTDFSMGGWGAGIGGGGSIGGYGDSPEGKVVAASFLDNYNKIVIQIRDQTTLIKPVAAEALANANASTKAEAPQQAGQVLVPKIGNVKVYEQPSHDAKVVATADRSEEMVASGEVQNGFVRIDSSNFSGWIQRTLVRPADTNSAAPPPQAVPVTSVTAPSDGFSGDYAGALDGDDQGNFTLTVAPDHVMYGTALLAHLGRLTLQGATDDHGNFRAVASGAGIGRMTSFLGRIDPATGSVRGNWASAMGNGGGSISGVRQH